MHSCSALAKTQNVLPGVMSLGLLCLVVAFFSWSCTEESPPTPTRSTARPAATAAPTPSAPDPTAVVPTATPSPSPTVAPPTRPIPTATTTPAAQATTPTPTPTTPAPMTTPHPHADFTRRTVRRHQQWRLSHLRVARRWPTRLLGRRPWNSNLISRFSRLRSGLSTTRGAVHLHQQWRVPLVWAAGGR